MRKKSCQKDWPRVPERYEGIQVNGCGAPNCENFELSPVPDERIYKTSNREIGDRQLLNAPEPFRVQGTGLNAATLACKSCEARKRSGEYSGGISSALKSNKAVAQELHRISSYLTGPDTNCPNGCMENGGQVKRRGKQPRVRSDTNVSRAEKRLLQRKEIALIASLKSISSSSNFSLTGFPSGALLKSYPFILRLSMEK